MAAIKNHHHHYYPHPSSHVPPPPGHWCCGRPGPSLLAMVPWAAPATACMYVLSPRHPQLWNQVLRVRGAHCPQPHHRLQLWNQVLQARWNHTPIVHMAGPWATAM